MGLLYRKFQDGGPPPEDKVNEILSTHGGLAALRKKGVTIEADESFNTDATGVGSIEYFSPDNVGRQSVIYDNGYERKHPKPGTHGVVYDPKTNDNQDIKLDLLHGMKNADPKYAKLRADFANDILNTHGGDMLHAYDEEKKSGGARDGKEAFIENWIDGKIRNSLIKGNDEYVKDRRYYMPEQLMYRGDSRINKSLFKLEDYINKGDGKYAPGYRRGGILYKVELNLNNNK